MATALWGAHQDHFGAGMVERSGLDRIADCLPAWLRRDGLKRALGAQQAHSHRMGGKQDLARHAVASSHDAALVDTPWILARHVH
ncbi:hypothetical protein D3C87_1127380 [compost metagenome]